MQAKSTSSSPLLAEAASARGILSSSVMKMGISRYNSVIPVPRQIFPQRMKVPSVNPYRDHKFTKPYEMELCWNRNNTAPAGEFSFRGISISLQQCERVGSGASRREDDSQPNVLILEEQRICLRPFHRAVWKTASFHCTFRQGGRLLRTYFLLDPCGVQ